MNYKKWLNEVRHWATITFIWYAMFSIAVWEFVSLDYLGTLDIWQRVGMMAFYMVILAIYVMVLDKDNKDKEVKENSEGWRKLIQRLDKENKEQ